MAASEAKLPLPESGLVYDYLLDDGGLSSGDSGNVEEEEEETKTEVRLAYLAFHFLCSDRKILNFREKT